MFLGFSTCYFRSHNYLSVEILHENKNTDKKSNPCKCLVFNYVNFES